MKLIFELSGENPTLPIAELGCVGTVLDQRRQVAIVESPDPLAARRLAMTHGVFEYLGECSLNWGVPGSPAGPCAGNIPDVCRPGQESAWGLQRA